MQEQRDHIAHRKWFDEKQNIPIFNCPVHREVVLYVLPFCGISAHHGRKEWLLSCRIQDFLSKWLEAPSPIPSDPPHQRGVCAYGTSARSPALLFHTILSRPQERLRVKIPGDQRFLSHSKQQHGRRRTLHLKPSTLLNTLINKNTTEWIFFFCSNLRVLQAPNQTHSKHSDAKKHVYVHMCVCFIWRSSPVLTLQ